MFCGQHTSRMFLISVSATLTSSSAEYNLRRLTGQSSGCRHYTLYYIILYITLYYVVAQLIEALRFKPEGRVFDFRWGFSDFSFI